MRACVMKSSSINVSTYFLGRIIPSVESERER